MVSFRSHHLTILFFGAFRLIIGGDKRYSRSSSCSRSNPSNATTINSLDNLFSYYGTAEDGFRVINEKNLHKLTKILSVTPAAANRDFCRCLRYNSTKQLINASLSRRKAPPRIQKRNQKQKRNLTSLGCLPLGKLLSLHGVNVSLGITKDDFIRICSALVAQISNKACVLQRREKRHSRLSSTSPSVWGYSFIAITLISFISLAVILVIPCIKKSFYNLIMGYLVALAVGTLTGDALLHLIPHAFTEGSNRFIECSISANLKLEQHYSDIWRALFVLLGIYLFFIVEQLMKLKEQFGFGGHGHSHGDRKSNHRAVDSEESLLITSRRSSNEKEEDVKELSELPTSDPSAELIPERNIDRKEDGIVAEEPKIASVAWMVIVGDGFHNFSDGLAVGAAFSASPSSGLSTAIAVLCHELPHELGDFAILIKSGMRIKQAIMYNLISALFAYGGMAVGILAGGNELARHFILSITAGLFLYISLANMLPELRYQDSSGGSQCKAYICQHLGLLSGVSIMLLISLYEHLI